MAANPTQIQFLRGTTAANDTYTGLAGVITYDTDKKTLRAHDGATAGGSVLAKEAILLKTDSDNLVQFNGGASADHSADVSITLNKSAVASTVASTIAASSTLTGTIAAAVSSASVSPTDNILFLNSSNAIATNVSLAVDTATNELKLMGGSAGTTEVSKVTLPGGALLKAANFVTSKPDPSGGPAISGAFIYLQFQLSSGATQDEYIDVAALVDVYTAGDGLQLNASDNHKIEAKVAATGNLLQIDGTQSLFVPADFGTL